MMKRRQGYAVGIVAIAFVILVSMKVLKTTSMSVMMRQTSIDEDSSRNKAAQVQVDADDTAAGVQSATEEDVAAVPYRDRWNHRFSSSVARGKRERRAGRRLEPTSATFLKGLSRDVADYENMREVATSRNQTSATGLSSKYDISYVEQEYLPLDWQCSRIDPRWQESLNIIVLRHPIERHLSEFFFSGVSLEKKKSVFGKQRRIIDREQLFKNRLYTDTLAQFIAKEVPYWVENSKSDDSKGNKTAKRNGYMFSRWYQDNFQLRALAGCSSGECLERKQAEQPIEMEKINEFHPLNYSYSTPEPICTQFFQDNLSFDVCNGKTGQVSRDQCSSGCDGPCSFPTVAEGSLDEHDVEHAIEALKQFDAILLMERLKYADQSAFVSDVMSVPRDAEFALDNTRGMNARVVKTNERELTHFYRDLLHKLNLNSVLELLESDNRLEIEFYNRAVDIYDRQMNTWKKETGWRRQRSRGGWGH
ncbi:hypothetical protein ACHAWC_007469 [Mediolabrus comicus]